MTGKIDLLLLTEFDNSTAELIEMVTNNGHIFYTGERRSIRWELLGKLQFALVVEIMLFFWYIIIYILLGKRIKNIFF